MTKDEMTTLLRSVGVNENTVTAMENAYELGFEQGAAMGDLTQDLIEAAVHVIRLYDGGEDPSTNAFWGAYHKMQGMV